MGSGTVLEQWASGHLPGGEAKGEGEKKTPAHACADWGNAFEHNRAVNGTMLTDGKKKREEKLTPFHTRGEVRVTGTGPLSRSPAWLESADMGERENVKRSCRSKLGEMRRKRP